MHLHSYTQENILMNSLYINASSLLFLYLQFPEMQASKLNITVSLNNLSFNIHL